LRCPTAPSARCATVHPDGLWEGEVRGPTLYRWPYGLRVVDEQGGQGLLGRGPLPLPTDTKPLRTLQLLGGHKLPASSRATERYHSSRGGREGVALLGALRVVGSQARGSAWWARLGETAWDAATADLRPAPRQRACGAIRPRGVTLGAREQKYAIWTGGGGSRSRTDPVGLFAFRARERSSAPPPRSPTSTHTTLGRRGVDGRAQAPERPCTADVGCVRACIWDRGGAPRGRLPSYREMAEQLADLRERDGFNPPWSCSR